MRLASLLPVALAVFMALPAQAQQSSTHTSGCQPHRNDQMRCAVRFAVVGNYQQSISLAAAGGGGAVTGQAQAWVSECGIAGSAGGVVDVASNGRTTLVRDNRGVGLAFACVEVFIINCRRNGQPVACSDGFTGSTIRVQFRQ